MSSRVNNFQNREGFKRKSNDEHKTEKKPFNKRKFREMKYSNKFKVNQWEERRKKAVMHHYCKELGRDLKANKNVSTSEDNKTNEIDQPHKKMSTFHMARKEFFKRKDEQKKKKEEALKAKAEMKEALEKYKEKKTKFIKVSTRKTNKGQPVMNDRLQLLFEKIQENVNS